MLVLALSLLLQAPPPLTGRVVTGAPARPVAGATVRTGGQSTTTDAEGRFTITLASGDAAPAIRLTISATGYLTETADIVPNAVATPLTVDLRPAPQVRESVQVTADASDTPAAPPTLTVQPGDVRMVSGAADNIFRVLQTLPGVAATEDFGSRLSVRGGSPDQNLTVMDGVEIHNPYRLFGLTSAFNPETINRFELTAGGFGPRYGDRLSSILVIDNRAGTSATPFAGSASMSLTDANVVFEGALPRQGTGSWLVTGRRTYYDLFAERVTKNDLPSFDDLQTKIVWAPAPGRRLTLFGLRSREATDARFDGDHPGDRIGVKDASRNDVVSLSFSSPIGRRVTTQTSASWYAYHDTLDVDGSVRDGSTRANVPGDDSFGRSDIIFTRALGVRDLALRHELTASLGAKHAIAAGGEAHGLRTSWGWVIAGDRNAEAANGSSVIGGSGLPDLLDSSANNARAGAWIEDTIRVSPGVHVAAGLRADWSQLISETAVSPRVRATIDFSAATRVRLAAGRYTQSPGYEKMLQSDYFVDLSREAIGGLTSERSIHWVSGIEHDVSSGVSARVEAYYKTLDHTIIGRLETPQEAAARVAPYVFPATLALSVPVAPQILSVPTNGGSGSAYGMDVYLQKRATSAGSRLTGWASYTWSKAFVENYGRRYASDYDRRHAFALVATWRLSRRLDVGATFRASSGFPATLPVGVRVAAAPDVDGNGVSTGRIVPARDLTGQLIWTADYGGVGNLNTARTPAYARLDLRVTFVKSRTGRWQFYGEVINALKRKNADRLSASLQYDPASDRPALTYSREGGFPLLPSFGLRFRF